MDALCKLALFSLLILAQVGGQNMSGEMKDDGKVSMGMDTYRSILERRPGLPEAHFGAGWEAYQDQNYDEAAREFEAALETRNSDLRSKAFYNLGNAWYQKGEFQHSLEAYRRSLEISPGDADAKHNYELALRMMHRPPAQSPEESPQEGEKENGTPDSPHSGAGDTREVPQSEPQDSGEETRADRESGEKGDAAAILNALEANDRNLMKRRWKTRESVTLEKDW
ncbi:MAG: tetratricopeptide repeat protein [Fidelibacterota bacterium]